MAERSIDDPVGRNSKHQLPGIDAGYLSRLRQQPVIGSIVELENAVENILVIGQACQNPGASLAQLPRNQPMPIPLVDPACPPDHSTLPRPAYRPNPKY